MCGQLGPARAVLAGRPGRAHRCHWVLMTARTLGSQEGLTDDTCMVAGYASLFQRAVFDTVSLSHPPPPAQEW